MVYSQFIAFHDLNADLLKSQYLTGLSLTGADGQELPPDFYAQHIANAIAKLEDMTNVDILTRVNIGERHDYDVNNYQRFGYIQLFRVPVQRVLGFRAAYPGGQAASYPGEWLRLDQRYAQLHMVPTIGSGQLLLGAGGDYLPYIFSGMGYLPSLWEIDYVSGFSDDTSPLARTNGVNISDQGVTGGVPRMIADAIMKLAVVEILSVMSDTVAPIGQTSQSLGVDGLSQSRSYGVQAFKSRVDRYLGDLGLPGPPYSGLIAQIRNTYLGFTLTSV